MTPWHGAHPAGYSCAHLAGVHGRCGVLQVLLKVGVSMQEEEEGRRAWTVVHHAAFHGRLGILQVHSLNKVEVEDVNIFRPVTSMDFLSTDYYRKQGRPKI